MKLPRWIATLGLSVAILPALADGPADNIADKVRPVPPPGIAVPDDVRARLQKEADELGAAVADLAKADLKPAVRARWADAAVLHKGVDWALRYNEFFRTNEFKAAADQLQAGRARVEGLRSGNVAWNTDTGPTVRGYVSRIDGSVQPYGLVVPSSYTPNSGRRWRLDFWFHGRGEQLSELSFIQDRMRSPGEFAPPDTFVLHLYGRYCNGSRFAGETDFWEALEDVRSLYPIDDDRLVVRGFSLGGASCWHFAVHHASLWAAAAPGAGFSETAEFLNVFQQETLQPFPWEQKLWRLHDATANALNLRMVPTVAYSGEDDRQIQAARAVERSLQSLGLELTHIIGPKTGHRYEPAAKQEINRRIDRLAARGRTRTPREVHFVTHTLRYPRMAWITVDALGEHWEPATIHAAPDRDGLLRIAVTNVTAFTLDFEPGEAPFDPSRPVEIAITGGAAEPTTRSVMVQLGRPGSDRSFTGSVHWRNGTWHAGRATSTGLRKTHGLQGPIDDAFMDRFTYVLPSGTPLNPAVGKWVESESTRAREQWRRHYRGDAPVVTDTALSDEQIARSNLILWGDPSSNQVLARMLPKLPLDWSAQGLKFGGKTYAADAHAPVLIFPNPLNPARYVVLNSGFTFREYDYLNNARQTPKLPDWAVIDLRTPPNSRYPGKVVAGGFFDESWTLR